MIINGGVYNLTDVIDRFIDVHPGGRKILPINAGMDASGDYNYVKHNLAPQIEALLLKNKVGELANVEFKDEKSAAIYKKCIQFLEALLEMANTLSNSTTYKTKVPLYVWREVYSILVEGHLRSYESRGSVGSLKYVLKTILDALNEELCIPRDQYRLQLDRLFDLASQCAEIIRTSTLSSSTDIHAKIEKITAELLQKTLGFIDAIKQAIISFAHELELLSDNPRISELTSAIEKHMALYIHELKQAQNELNVFKDRQNMHPVYSAEPTGGVCPAGFGRQADSETKVEVESGQPSACPFAKDGVVRPSGFHGSLFARREASSVERSHRLLRPLLTIGSGMFCGMLAMNSGPLVLIAVVAGAMGGYSAPDIADALTSSCRKQKMT